jgi:hypothetical protein
MQYRLLLDILYKSRGCIDCCWTDKSRGSNVAVGQRHPEAALTAVGQTRPEAALTAVGQTHPEAALAAVGQTRPVAALAAVGVGQTRLEANFIVLRQRHHMKTKNLM